MTLSTIAFRNLARHKVRSFLSILTLVLACIFGLFMLTLITGMEADMKQNILAYYTGAIQIRHADYNTYDYLNPIHLYVNDEAAVREKLLQVDGVTQAMGRITARFAPGENLRPERSPLPWPFPGPSLSATPHG